jgi:hypothetical protein
LIEVQVSVFAGRHEWVVPAGRDGQGDDVFIPAL